MNQSIKTIGRLFLLAASLLAVSAGIIYWIGQDALINQRRIASERSNLQTLQIFVSTLKDAETGQRGYLLTSDESYLAPYQQAVASVKTQEVELRRLAAAGELSGSGVENLITLSEEKLAELLQTIEARHNNGVDAALAIVRAGQGKAIMDKIRAEAAALEADKQREIDISLHHEHVANNVRNLTLIFAILLNLVFLTWSFRRIVREVLARETAVLETRRQKELLATTLASIGDAVIVTDAGGRVTYLNAEAERLTGWNNAEAGNQLLPAVFHILNESSRQVVENPVEKVLRLGTVVGLANHTILIAKDGHETPIDDSAAPIRLADGSIFGVVLVFRDFSLQKKANELKAHMAAIVASSGSAIMSKTLEGIVQTWNPSAEKLFGYTPAEIIGKSVRLLVPPDRLDEEEQTLQRVREGQPWGRLDTIRIAKDGRQIHVSISVSPIKDIENHVVGASTIIDDITEIKRVETELRDAKDQLARVNVDQEKVIQERTRELREMVDELQHVSYAIAHDMRAPLRAMGVFAEQLLEEAIAQNAPDRTRDYCQRIITGAGRLDRLIRDSLNYSQTVLQQPPLEQVDLEKLLQGLISTYPNLHPEKADIQITGPLPVVLGNESLLTQCFSNLLGNAVKFVPSNTRPQIRVWAETGTGKTRIWVQDNGIGISANAQRRLFGMFQKLDSEYEGTGIGLAIVRKVVNRMGGVVGVESEPGKGSRFWVELRTVPNGTPRITS